MDGWVTRGCRRMMDDGCVRSRMARTARARAGAGRARVRVGYITRKSIVDVVARVRSRVTRGARRDRIHGWKPRAPYLTFIPRAIACVVFAKQGNAVSSGYAAALVDACKSGGVLEQVHADMETLDAYVKANAAVAGFLANPTMAVDKKKDILAKLGKEAGFHAFTSNFLNLLVDKKRENQLETIIAEFETLFCEATDTQVRFDAKDYPAGVG